MYNLNKKVLILLSTYNGEKYLKEQLDSLFSQSYKNFEIIARDDVSIDKTVKILKSYNINILDSKKNLGPKKSFAALLEYALENTEAEYFIFCDQDDIWKKDKIEKTLNKMQSMEKTFSNIPLLVHTDLEVVDDRLNVLSDSFWKYEKKNPSLNRLNRLLMQSTVTGCTMMINRKLAKISLPIPQKCIMHDWWMSLVATQFGQISFISDATILYRQHANNDTGSSKFDIQKIISKGMMFLFYDELYKHLDKNINQSKDFLKLYKKKLNKEEKIMLENFMNIKSKSFFEKRKILLKYGLLKQGFYRNLVLFLKI